MHVVSLVKYQRKDIGIVLRHLIARHESGHLKGLAVCCKTVENDEEISFTGDYRDDPSHALSAALKMSRFINDLEDRLAEAC